MLTKKSATAYVYLIYLSHKTYSFLRKKLIKSLFVKCILLILLLEEAKTKYCENSIGK
jgi:hypothetical protein